MQTAVKSRLKRHEWRALGLCILISATIWLLRALNAPAIGHVEVKLRYGGDSDCAIARCVPPLLELEIEASGFEVLGHTLIPGTRVLDLQSSDIVQRGEERYVPVTSINRELRDVVRGNAQVRSISIDTVVVYCEAP
jgi:hypothetical protein